MRSQSISQTRRVLALAPVAPSFPRSRPAVGFLRLPSPAEVISAMPPGGAAAFIERARDEARAVLDGRDDRLLAVVGPCSVHDPRAAIEYACWLAGQSADLRSDLLVVMRCYLEKPRTTTGWRGLVADPRMDGSCDMATGIMTARALLQELAEQEVPAACEWVDPAVEPYLSDLVTWGAIGARTVESQRHRQLASGLTMPVGMKNGTGGDIQAAAGACRAAAVSHTFLGTAPDGGPAAVTTAGNKDTCIVLRGGSPGPNYQPQQVADALAIIERAGLPPRFVVDASHGNSGKDPGRQAIVAASIASQVAGGNAAITGIMLESNLVAGRQEPGDPAALTYGQSVTDACIGTEATATILRSLAASVRARRAARKQAP